MNDLIKCPKCEKETNRYSPSCEHCLQLLDRDVPESTQTSDTKEETSAGESAETIAERGRVLHEALGKYSGPLKKCPFCAEEIHLDAIKCRYCGELIKKPAKPRGRYKIFLVVFLACIAVSVVLVLIYVALAGSAKDSAKIKPGKAINELSLELKADSVKAGYVKNYITLTGVGTLEEADSKLSSAQKYFYGTIKNSGNKTVIKLTVTAYFFDKKGRCVDEATASPIFGTKGKPDSLKPNSSKDFQLPIANISPGWSGGIKAKVSDIEVL